MTETPGNQDRSVDEKSKKRRTRKDEEGRNYNCTCGKSYLSYPALYTHIKTKHGGKAEFNKSNPVKDDGQSTPKDDEDVGEEPQDEVSDLQALQKYLISVFPFTQKERAAGRALSPCEEAYLKTTREYWEKHRKEDEHRDGDVYATNMEDTFGLFLYEMDRELSSGGMRFTQELILDIRRGINELKNCHTYCKNNPSSDVPYLMNDLFTEKLQKMPQGHIYRKHPTIVCKVLYHLSRWLFHEHFTNLSLKFNTV